MWIIFEIIELALAFMGGIWAFQIVLSWINGKEEEDIRNEEYYIGDLSLQKAGTNKNVVCVSLYMKELDSKRSIRQYKLYAISDSWKELFWNSEFGLELNAWVDGGAFPRKFNAIEPLGEMLNRMMKRKFGIEENDDAAAPP